MRLVDAALPWFARHETFHPRYGWFRKAYAVVTEEGPNVFSREDAPVVIGVGKNMVRAIRFWGLAAKVIVEDSNLPKRRPSEIVPTRRGHALFGEGGWDPYMEDPGTLWLLHWLLLARPSRLPVWWLVFNEFNAVEFDDNDLEDAIITQLEAAADWPSPNPSSVKKDLGALLRSYALVERPGRTSIDDLLDCPLRELNLLSRSRATGRYRFTLGPKPTLPSAIVAHAVLDYVARTLHGGRTITLSHLAQQPGAPGRAFKLTEAELLEALRPSLGRTDHLRLATPLGAPQLAWSDHPERIATAILDDYYDSPESEICAGPTGDLPVAAEILDDLGLGHSSEDPMRALLAASRSR